MESKLISVIMPCYNGEMYIGRAIESVVAQSYPEWELIIIDHQSTDGSRTVVSEFLNNRKISLLSLDGKTGVSAVRNFGLSKSNGRFIAFLDCDDIWKERKIEIQLAEMEKRSLSLGYTAFTLINSTGHIISDECKVPLSHTKKSLLKDCNFRTSSVVIDKSRVGEFCFDENLETAEDFALWLKIINDGHMIGGTNETGIFYRVHDNSFSNNKFMQAKYRLIASRKYANSSWFTVLKGYLGYMVTGLIKTVRKNNR